MRLSEAMRIGASWSPQIITFWKTINGTCALGAAYEGTFGTLNLQGASGMDMVKLFKTYPILIEKCTSPEPSYCSCIGDAIPILNDSYNWTREEIANWIEIKELELGYYDEAEKPEDSLVKSQEVGG